LQQSLHSSFLPEAQEARAATTKMAEMCLNMIDGLE
jgi:hypothetical protein